MSSEAPGPATPARARFEDLFSQIGEEVQAMRIAVAQQRDGMLTEAEHIAMLEVYGEFGR